MRYPIKAAVLAYGLERGTVFSAKEASSTLQRIYPGEKTASTRSIENILQVYCGVGIMRAAHFALAGDAGEDDIEVLYEVTEYGRTCRKLLPERSPEGEGNRKTAETRKGSF